MDENLKRTIYETMSDVFETMFFTFIQPLSSVPTQDEWGQDKSYVESKISFSCEMAGTVTLFTPTSLAKFITINFLGIDESELKEPELLDTMRETVNMSVGSLLGKIDPEGKCNLGIPEAAIINDFSPENIVNEPGICPFNTEFGILWALYKGR